MFKFHILHRSICLTLFLASSIASYFNPHMIYIAGLSIIGVIAYDIVCFFKEKNSPKDYSSEIEDMKIQHEATYRIVKEMKDDVSVAKLANSFRSR